MLYPNPASKELFLENLELNSTIEIYTTLGELVYSDMNTSVNFRTNLEDKNPGLYLVKIKNGLNIQNLKFLLHK
jgi:hypothetical protein